MYTNWFSSYYRRNERIWDRNNEQERRNTDRAMLKDSTKEEWEDGRWVEENRIINKT